MDTLLAIPLSLNTLGALFSLPFLYFVYQTRYWYRPDLLKRFDLLLQGVLILLGAAVFWKIFQDRSLLETHFVLILLHFGILIITSLTIGRTKLERYVRSREPQASRSSQHKERKESEQSFSPAPLNEQIERLSWDQIVIDRQLKSELLATIDLLRDPSEADRYGVDVPKGILLAGPPGCGKTTIAKAMANTAGLSLFAVRSDEIVSKWVGESEKNLSLLFQAALKHAPSVIFIDEIDALGRARSGKGQQWAENLLNHLLQLIDGVVKTRGLYVIGATNRADLVDPALKRSGRLNKTIEIPLPALDERCTLFALHLSRLQIEDGVEIEELAQATRGASGADIKEICNQAGLRAFQREAGSKSKSYIVTRFDLDSALSEFLSNRNGPQPLAHGMN